MSYLKLISIGLRGARSKAVGEYEVKISLLPLSDASPHALPLGFVKNPCILGSLQQLLALLEITYPEDVK